MTKIQKTITVQYLRRELDSITKVVGKLATRKQGDVFNRPLAQVELQRMHIAVDMLGYKADSPFVPHSIIAAQKAIVEVNKRTELNAAFTTASRAQLMVTDMLMWRWLWRTERKAIRVLSPSESAFETTPEWIGTLVRVIRDKLLLRKSFKIESSKFLRGVSPVTYEYLHKRGDTAYADPELLLERTRDVFTYALMKWLGYPTGRAAPYRAEFVFYLMHRFDGPGVLYLPAVWSTRLQLRACLFDDPTDLATVDWTAVSNSLSTHPLANPTSLETRLLQQLEVKYGELLDLSSPVSWRLRYYTTLG